MRTNHAHFILTLVFLTLSDRRSSPFYFARDLVSVVVIYLPTPSCRVERRTDCVLVESRLQPSRVALRFSNGINSYDRHRLFAASRPNRVVTIFLPTFSPLRERRDPRRTVVGKRTVMRMETDKNLLSYSLPVPRWHHYLGIESENSPFAAVKMVMLRVYVQ